MWCRADCHVALGQFALFRLHFLVLVGRERQDRLGSSGIQDSLVSTCLKDVESYLVI